jgi:hypothetical protein
MYTTTFYIYSLNTKLYEDFCIIYQLFFNVLSVRMSLHKNGWFRSLPNFESVH